MTLDALALPVQAHAAAAAAARRAGVAVVEIADVTRLGEAARLFEEVWGTSPEGAPVPADLLRSLTHAGGGVSAAYDPGGALAGAAVAVLSTPGAAYSLVAAVRPGGSDRGIGFALKQHQRAWALERGLDTVAWTFDPLVGRNARFNLTRLGARATAYVESFYGPMADRINAGDETDRLVATWWLADERVVACSELRQPEVGGPTYDRSAVREHAPDGEPLLVDAGGVLWCRVPADIVAVRRRDPEAAARWRQLVRRALSDALADGYVAADVTRSGWYRLVKEERA